ncbi:hypothetical protein EDM80_11690 [bacterium]|nr:MAG: hypothetical protein EDM80_11690 [bacterium]RIK59878.1 MAG: hypothetical protein DCC64_15430 [Planctomycetota bacterium]
MFRQGDILLVFESAQLNPLVKPAPAGGRLVLAHGEKTGHTHSLPASDAVMDVPADPAKKEWLYVLRRTELTHQEHDAITLERGIYQVIRQRQYDPGRDLPASD